MKLELGGGNFPKTGFISIDRVDFTPDTIVHDLEKGLPVYTNNKKIEEIYADNVLEHITNLIQLMNDCWKALEKGGIMTIIVPLFPYISSIKDPTHVRFFVSESFDYFDKDWDYVKQPDYGIKKWTVKENMEFGEGEYKFLKVILEK